MSQVYDSLSVPQGFQAAGTYSGLCSSRVKLDVAMIVSRRDCSIVTATSQGLMTQSGKILLLHNGTALPDGPRGHEISQEVCQAAGKCMDEAPDDIALVASGAKGQYFRPSLLIHSLKTLTAGLGTDSQPLEAVLDNAGDVTAYQVALSSGTPGCSLSGVAADGTADSSVDGLCVIMTDAQAGSAVIEGALAQAKAAIDTENFTFIVMANGMAGSSPCSQEVLADGLEQLLKKLGFQNSLKACS